MGTECYVWATAGTTKGGEGESVPQMRRINGKLTDADRSDALVRGLITQGSQVQIKRHIVPLLAVRRTKHGSGLGRFRWVVERTFAWLSQFRRLRVRYEKRADIHEAFLALGCAPICGQSLRQNWLTGLSG
jgi:transposase